MTLTTFIKKYSLSSSLLIGFYGGGNYGDELLMETFAGLLKQRRTQNLTIAYQHPENYHAMHHDFGFDLVDMHSKPALIKSVLAKKNIIVGGGGLWGMDSNFNLFLLCLLMFMARWFLGKKVYLVAVGYYGSAQRLGRASAWLAGKAATAILARDPETYHNFKAIQRNTSQDTDIAWYIDELDLAPYAADLAQLEKRLPITGKTLFMTLRRFHSGPKQHLSTLIGQCLQNNADKPIIIALLEPRHVDPEGYKLLESWQQNYPNVQILDFSFNPLALFLFFRKHHKNLVFIGPQFHAILSAHLTGVPYLPMIYDNKVRGLLEYIAPKRPHYMLQSLGIFDVQSFIDKTYNKTA